MLNSGSTALPYQPYAPAIIKGNMVQSGTPSPSSVIMPSECGERTGNLFDDFDIVGQVPSVSNGNLVNYNNGACTDLIEISSGLLALSIYESMVVYVFLYDANKSFLGWANITSAGTSTTRTIINYENAKYARVRTDNYSTYLNEKKIMLNSGSTALPYQPYGYYLPILCGGTTTPVYLGEVESTRQIKKYEFTGQETNIDYNSLYTRFEVYLSNAKSNGVRLTPAFCSHYQVISDGRAIGDVPYESLYSDVENSTRWFIKTTDYTTVADFKSYLAQQYANGTPVTVWYVLETETTGILNEPLRKIGTYADSVSVANIPTTAGKQTFDVDTTLKPSEVSLNYHSWHRDKPMIKSKNLFDKNQTFGVGYYDDNGELHIQTGDNATEHTELIPTNGITTFTIKGLWDYFSGASAFTVYEWDSSKNWLRRSNRTTDVYTNTPITFDVGNDAAYFSLQVMTKLSGFTYDSTMLNTGNSALPYQPYWVE